MRIIPWRVKAFLSNHFPLAYHLAVNVGWRGNSEQHWDRMLEETWDDPARAWPTKNDLIESLTQPEMKILDVACGTGSILRTLKQRGFVNLYALEISGYAVSRLNSEGIHARRGMLPRIDFPGHEFDIVIASQVLEHVIRRGTFARELRRVLKPDGRVFIFVPNNCLGPIDEPEHVIAYTAESLQRFLSKYFVVEGIKGIHDANHESPILFAQVRA
jgi:2-polyprenyl-3-methyl-5-hydroxy-6-metoxy-1,4-benzoquinol methylase